MSKNMSGKALLVLGLTGALGVGALAWYVKKEPGAAKIPVSLERGQDTVEPSPLVRKSRTRPVTEDNDNSDQGDSVQLVKISGTDASLPDSKVAVPDGAKPMEFVAQQVLKEANAGDVKVIGVDLKRGTAVINFDEKIQSGMGTEQEAGFLKALQVAFGQFPDVRKIQLDCENQPMDHLDELEIPGTLDVIKAGESSESRTSKPPQP